LILGIILGPMAESYFLTTLIAEGNDFGIFFRRPVSAIVLIASLSLLFMPIIQKTLSKGKNRKEERHPPGR
jgi:putative tricarboxylic transport membrane protein